VERRECLIHRKKRLNTRHRGRSDVEGDGPRRGEMRVDVENGVVFITAIVEPTEPELIRKIGVCQRGDRRDRAHQEEKEEVATTHLESYCYAARREMSRIFSS
jgi:hypothetical protein